MEPSEGNECEEHENSRRFGDREEVEIGAHMSRSEHTHTRSKEEP